MTDELALVAAARRGELQSFNTLVERYQVLVFNVCRRMLASATDAEDVTQETFFAAYRSLSSYRGGSFRGWLLHIAANQCYDLLRKHKRQPQEVLADDWPVPDAAPGPERLAMAAETLREIETALGTLPPDQRLLVLLVDVQGLDYAEAAQAAHTTLGTVKSRLSRARAALRGRLQPSLPAGQP